MSSGKECIGLCKCRSKSLTNKALQNIRVRNKSFKSGSVGLNYVMWTKNRSSRQMYSQNDEHSIASNQITRSSMQNDAIW